MSESSELLADAVVDKLVQLLTEDEAGWLSAAHWIDGRALDEGIDLFAQFDSAEIFARSLLEGLRGHIRLNDRLPNGVAELARFEVAEELFWHLMPKRSRE
jgi:hypothetical protein